MGLALVRLWSRFVALLKRVDAFGQTARSSTAGSSSGQWNADAFALTPRHRASKTLIRTHARRIGRARESLCVTTCLQGQLPLSMPVPHVHPPCARLLASCFLRSPKLSSARTACCSHRHTRLVQTCIAYTLRALSLVHRSLCEVRAQRASARLVLCYLRVHFVLLTGH
ncbi:hypothetical protein EXIGLDRAFT_323519 [Exidia glandulosa HHB12029]|uniref:Secreted protein n=1 Tax=Exidia glandulosa HHB12029 TaxID=1314781 RepID=A0A165CVF6_EXIGL|nr:hypothetical protein EXIGLDRAFT_323519 [Exidia glandulosa HHB12029]